MVPLKWGVWEFGVYRVLGVCGGIMETKGEMEGTPISVTPSLVSTQFYLCSLTFSLRPDEVVSVWRLQKLVFNKLMDLLCYSTQEIL